METRKRSNALVNGYIREFSKTNKNKQKGQIPNDINDLIFSFFYMLIGSDMLTNEEEEQLMVWIDNSGDCDFNLLFKATRDGFGAAEFHKRCDGKGANISIIRSGNECIFGGYTSKSWHNENDYISDDFAWLYSLRNVKGIRKKLKTLYPKYALSGMSAFGPYYGKTDLFILNDCNVRNYSMARLSDNYEGSSNPLQLNDGIERFAVLDYEIWQIINDW